MFVYYFTHLQGSPEGWVATLDGERARLSALARAAAQATSRQARGDASSLVLGEADAVAGGFVAHMELRVPGLFEEMVGDLRLEQIDLDETQLTLSGSYTAESDGEEQSHRLVEAFVKRFVDSVRDLTYRTDGPSTLAR